MKQLKSIKNFTGEVLNGGLRIGQSIGCGGMGVTYEGLQVELDRRVCVKFLSEVSDVQLFERFKRESKSSQS